jgi:hypothetical protein
MCTIDVFSISRHLVVGDFPVCHHPLCKFTPLRSSIWRFARLAVLCLLVLAASILQMERASAQSACAQLGVNCNLPAPPPVPPPTCYDPATGATISCSYQAPSSTPRTSTPRTPAPQSSATILNNAIQQQVVGAMVQGFFQMLFSSDPQADAQKQQMMQELQLRQAEAEQQHNIEEAQRLAAICNRLQASLKLAGLPELQMKSAGGGGLQLKLSDSGSGSRHHVGEAGLPGIALNDSTGNGGTTPYGEPGLPGIYTNGPGSGSGSATSDGPKLSLKMDDGSTPPAPPAPVEGFDTAGTITDVRKMSPQQLADLATKIDNLPPEEQQRLMDAARNSAGGNPPVANPAPAGGDANPAPAGAAPNPSAASATASQPAQSQLQQIAATSQSAATAASPEAASALASSGFDTAGGGSVRPAVAISGTTVAAIPAPASSQPNALSNAPLPPAHSPARASAPAAPVVDLISLASPSGSAAPAAGVAPALDRHESADASCPPGVAKLVPSRQQLETELAVRQAQMESLRSTILRMDRSIQLDQKQFAVWQDEASAAIDRLKDEIWDKATDLAFDNFLDSEEEHIKEAHITDAQRADKLRRLELAKNIKDFDDFRVWALSNQDDWGMIEDGMRSLVDYLPLEDGPLAYVHCAEDLIDNAYDLTDYVATWNNVQQLDHNSDQFLQAVRLNGERMTALVRRIQQIKAQLNAAPVGAPGTPACHSATAGLK